MLTRRHLLKLTAATLPGLAIGCAGGFEPEEVPESVERFPRTPIAGDMQPTRIVITFFVADDTPVTLRVWNEEEGVVVDQEIDASGDGFHKVMIDELTPGTTYHYAVFGGQGRQFEDRSLIGQVRTPPTEDVLVPVTLAMLSCVGQGTVIPDYYMPPGTTNETEEPFQWELFTHAHQHDIDAFVHLGDQAYLDFVWSQQDGTLEAYLNAWHYYHGGGYRDLYPLAGLYASWDDHEATDNGRFDPWDMTAEEVTKLENAHAAWYKVVPIDAMTPADGPVWRAYRWGGTVELILLDCRYELEPDRQMSPEQLAWLLERIETSPCRFICVATPKPFAQITSSSEFGADNADRWENYPADRVQVTDLIDELDAKHVIFVCGDIHMNYLGRANIAASTTSESVWEVCTTSGNISPMANFLDEGQFTFVDQNPHLPVLHFDPDAGTVHVAFYDSTGALAYEQTLEM